MDLKKDAMVEHLIMQGAIQFAGIDNETGEMTYSITDKLEEVNPYLYEQLRDQYEDHMFEMIRRGPQTMTWRLK
jgi:hypothetical protein